jgi:hypothetical protein
MQTIHSGHVRRRFARIGGLVAGAAALSTVTVADAHFILKAPVNWMAQDSLGTPQKMGPCGNEAPQTPTHTVTPFQPGQQVTIQIDETVFHPGHYRIALAPTQNELPAEPAVTPTAADQCASAAVQENPTLPILADNQLVHTTQFSGTQTITVTLPANPPCTNCVLQVLEFMSSHGAPCFYHHCANITIAASGTPGDAGAGGDAAPPDAPAPAADSGCSCSTARREGPALSSLAFLAAFAVAARTRRARRSKDTNGQP